MSGAQRLVQGWPYAVAIVCGIGIAYVNLRTDELFLVAALLFTVAFILGLARSRHAWRWAFLVAVWTPLGQAYAFAVAMRLPFPNEPDAVLATAFGVLLAGLWGAYAGVAAGRVVARGEDRAARKPR